MVGSGWDFQGEFFYFMLKISNRNMKSIYKKKLLTMYCKIR